MGTVVGSGPAGTVFRRNSFYRETWGTRREGCDVAKRSSDPPTAVRHGRARQCSGTRPCGDCRRAMWVPGPRSRYSGKIRFIEKPGVQDEWGRHVAELSSEPQAAVRHGSARQSSGTGPCGVCRRVIWVPDPRGQYSKKIRFIEKHEVHDEEGRHVSKHSFDPPPAAVRYGRAMQSSGTGSCRDCSRVL